MTKNHIGDRFGHWTYLEHRGQKGLFRCDCGTEVERFKSNIFDGKSTQCQSCGFKAMGATKTNNYDLDWKMNRVFGHYKTRAKTKGRSFSLTREQAWGLSQQSCYYCGQAPSLSVMVSQGGFNFQGLDRIDSSRDYHLNNVRPCCWDCNSAKKTMGDDEFKEWVIGVYMTMKARIEHGG